MLLLQESEVERQQSSINCSEAAVYTGDLCRSELESSLACFTGNTAPSPIMIPAVLDQQEAEEMVAMFFGGLELLGITIECEVELRPFLCLLTFTPCIGDEILSSDSETCMDLRDIICAREWMIARQFITLPVCEELPLWEEECKGIHV